MFSSLPSASKIYVQSSKAKHKNLSSAKKKRKKSPANICTPVHVYDEETLVSSTSLQNCSSSRLSLTGLEESLKNEIKYETNEEITNPGSDDTDGPEENDQMSSVINCDSNIKHVGVNETNDNEHSPCLISMSSQIIIGDNADNGANRSFEEEEKEILTNEKTDSIYCDEYAASDNYKTKEIQTDSDILGSKSMLLTSDPKSYEEQCDKQSINYEEVNSILPQVQPTSKNSVPQRLEEISNNEEDILSKNDKENYFHAFFVKDTKYENLEHSKDDMGSTTFSSEDIACENNKASCNDLCVLIENKDTLKIVSDIDSSSVRSDCCQSSNIYDIHVISSEHSSVDENENQMSGGEECRVQSPEQSEKSCTESVMYDSRSICQNEFPYQQSSVTDFRKKHIISESSHGNFTSIEKLSENISNSSCNFKNFVKLKPNYIMKRSLSLPERLDSYRSTEVFDKVLQDAFIIPQSSNSNKSTTTNTKFCYTSDKSTFTVEETDFKYSKSTTTLDTLGAYFNKKDVATTPLKNDNLKPVTENKSVATSLKDSTMLIMKVLPPVAVLQARARSYVFGSIGPTGSLLGNEELLRFFPDNQLTIFVGTWNMNGQDPPESIDDFLLPLDISSVPDVYAVGIQESMQSRSEWEILLQTTLGPSHVLFASTSFGVLHLSIFMRRDLIWFCSEPEEANVAVRPGSMIKTKGAVAICFMFFGTSILFVNSHLTAHEQKLRERFSDYEKICASLDLPKQIPLKPHQRVKDVTSRFDCVFWCGDLNFRVVQDRSSVLSFVEEKIRRESSCNSLTEHDQLTQAMAKGLAFHGFNEGVINFVPSYKFDVGTSFFDSTKQRVPSYTDRILYRSKDKSSVTCLHYNAVREIFTSDHKPVYGVFKVSIKPGRDNIRLSGGLFKREIYLEAIKRRAQQLEVTRNHKQSTICSVM